MSRTFIRQDAQIRGSVLYTDNVAPTEANFETNASTIEDDLNNLRSLCHNLLKNQAGNWWDDLNVPSTLETGIQRGVNDLNTGLHAVEKKRIVRELLNIGTDILVPSEVKATGTLTFGSNPSDTQTVTIDTKVYTFQATLTEADGNVHIGTDVEASLDNLIAAINLSGGDPGTDYANAMTAHTTVSASAGAGDAMDVEAILGGTQGNLIATTDTVTGAPNWSNPTLISGAGDLAILALGALPVNKTAAVGVVTTLGTVCAYDATFAFISLDEVAGSHAINPANRLHIINSNTGDPILSAGRKVYGLFQCETITDGHTLTGTTATRAKISFVRPNATYDDLEYCPSSAVAGKTINYFSRERVRLEDLSESDFLVEPTIDVEAEPGTIYRHIDLIGLKNGSNTTFTTPHKFDRSEFKEILLHNGVRQEEGASYDYTVSESGGVGTGYDTIEMAIALYSWEQLCIDYQVDDGGGFTDMVIENVPMLEYSSASVVNVLSKPGKSGSLKLVLSNDLEYVATSPLTMNMATSGLGGLEASASEAGDTWYYIYAVPSATNGQFDIIASPNDPETGPDDYTVWKYLGAFRNDASSNILGFYIIGKRYYQYKGYKDIGALTTNGSWNHPDLSSKLPRTCDGVKLQVRNSHSSSSISLGVALTGATDFVARSLTCMSVELSVDLYTSPKSIAYNTPGSGNIYICGWYDAYLD